MQDSVRYRADPPRVYLMLDDIKGNRMDICQTCNQPIKETVVEGRKLIAKVHTGTHSPHSTGRYLTVLNLTCACGVRVERRYENRSSPELEQA
jgi:hypothetical protein